MKRAARNSGIALLSLVVCAWAVTALAQGPPVTATLFLKNPPPNAIYAPGIPITIVVQVQNSSGSSVNTTQGFATTDFWRRLVFTAPTGGLIINTAEAVIHGDTRLFYCFSRQGVLQRPTTIPVVPIEVLAGPPTPFFVEFTIDDARRFYALTQSGRYTGIVQFPLQAFTVSDPNAVITDCDQFLGQPVVNVGAATLSGRQQFTVVSNPIEFIISGFTFGGFQPPLVNDAACAPTAPPCKTIKFGSTLPVKFQLFDANNAVVTTATPHIKVAQIPGTAPSQVPDDLGSGATDTGDLFRFDPTATQYIFNLDTKVLAPGVWRIDAVLDDGTVRSVYVGLQ